MSELDEEEYISILETERERSHNISLHWSER